MITIWFDEDVHRKIKAIAALRGEPLGKALEALVENYNVKKETKKKNAKSN